jgi:hypothetical protein
MQMPPPRQTRRRHGAREEGKGRLQSLDKRGPFPRRAGEGAAPSPSPSPPRPAERAEQQAHRSSAQLLLATTASQEKRGGADPCPPERRMAEAASAYWKRRWPAAPRPASPEKRSHGGDNPQPGSGRLDPRNSTADSKKPTTARSKQLDLHLRPPTPPHRRSQPAAPARATAGWVSSLCISLGYCSAWGGEEGENPYIADTSRWSSSRLTLSQPASS